MISENILSEADIKWLQGGYFRVINPKKKCLFDSMLPIGSEAAIEAGCTCLPPKDKFLPLAMYYGQVYSVSCKVHPVGYRKAWQ